MTESIKLPPLGRAAGIWAPAYGENEVRNYMRLAVESATGDLRAELTAHKRLNKDLETESVKAFAERDEARAEVERLREAFYESLVPELQELRDQNRDLRAEVERLRAAFHESQARELAALQELDEARAEVERLRAELARMVRRAEQSKAHRDEVGAELTRLTTLPCSAAHAPPPPPPPALKEPK